MLTTNLDEELSNRILTQKISQAQIRRLYAIAKSEYGLTSIESETVFRWGKEIYTAPHKTDLPAIANDDLEELFTLYQLGKQQGLTFQEIDAAFQKTKSQYKSINQKFVEQVKRYFEIFLNEW